MLIHSSEMDFAREQAKLWEMIDVTHITKDYRRIASVERDDGGIYDLGQNAGGEFLLFRRRNDPWQLNSHHKGERLSIDDYTGFDLGSRGYSWEQVSRATEEGEYSSKCTSNLILP